MAAAVSSSPWAKPGAWALEAEEQDAAEEQQKQAPPPPPPSTDFPSLAAAATTKTKKKNKGQTISLAEFTTYGAPITERLTQAELVSLPTGPRERSAEELDRSKLGNGFRSYGSGNRESSNSRWGSSRDSEDGERRGSFNRDRDSGPSRADETDNWAAAKKPIAAGFERRERSGAGFFESSQSHSKADEVDSWVSTKPSGRFVSTNGGDRFEKRGSFESLSRNRDSQDSWGRRREETDGVPPPPTSAVSRPRLVLQARTLPAPVVEVKPGSPVKVFTTVEKPLTVEKKTKSVNPFGSARPREEVLAEKGQDWKEIEEKLEADKLKDVAAAMEKQPDERSSGKKMGFGLGNGPKDARTNGSWKKSTEESVEGAQQEEPAVEDANKDEAEKSEEVAQHEEPAVEDADKEEAENKN